MDKLMFGLIVAGVLLALIGALLYVYTGNFVLGVTFSAGSIALLALVGTAKMEGELKELELKEFMKEQEGKRVAERDKAGEILAIFLIYAVLYVLGYRIEPLALGIIVAGWVAVSAIRARRPSEEMKKVVEELSKSVEELKEEVEELNRLLKE